MPPSTARSAATGQVQLRSEEAHHRIRSMILSGELPPNEVVSEADLARRLGMSRTPVREALRRLQAKQLIDAVPGVGYVVTALSGHDLVDVYMVRASLEGLAAEHAAARRTRTVLAQLEDLYEQMGACIETGDDAGLAVLNSEFHLNIARASSNQYLVSILGDIRGTFERFRPVALAHPGRREDAHAEHGQLIEALKSGDAAAAGQLATAHVHRALDVRRAALLTEDE